MPQLLCVVNRGLALSRVEGFIMLPNVLIVAIVALMIGGLLIIVGIGSLETSFSFLLKNQALSLNHACAEEALFQIRQFPSYTGTDNVTVGGRTCTYTVTNAGGENRRAEVISAVAKLTTRTLVLLSVNASSTVTIQSWKEVVNF